jgi:hypothetical protein
MGLDLTVIHLRDGDVKNNLSGVMDFLRSHPALTGSVPLEETTLTLSGTALEETTPPLWGTPPKEGNCEQNSPPLEGWQAKPDGVVQELGARVGSK